MPRRTCMAEGIPAEVMSPPVHDNMTAMSVTCSLVSSKQEPQSHRYY